MYISAAAANFCAFLYYIRKNTNKAARVRYTLCGRFLARALFLPAPPRAFTLFAAGVCDGIVPPPSPSPSNSSDSLRLYSSCTSLFFFSASYIYIYFHFSRPLALWFFHGTPTTPIRHIRFGDKARRERERASAYRACAARRNFQITIFASDEPPPPTRQSLISFARAALYTHSRVCVGSLSLFAKPLISLTPRRNL